KSWALARSRGALTRQGSRRALKNVRRSMVFQFEIDGERVKVALEPRGDRRFLARVGEQELEVDYAGGSLLVEGRSLEFTSANDRPGRATVTLDGDVVSVAVPSNRPAAAGPGRTSGTVCAPM